MIGQMLPRPDQPLRLPRLDFSQLSRSAGDDAAAAARPPLLKGIGVLRVVPHGPEPIQAATDGEYEREPEPPSDTSFGAFVPQPPKGRRGSLPSPLTARVRKVEHSTKLLTARPHRSLGQEPAKYQDCCQSARGTLLGAPIGRTLREGVGGKDSGDAEGSASFLSQIAVEDKACHAVAQVWTLDGSRRSPVDRASTALPPLRSCLKSCDQRGCRRVSFASQERTVILVTPRSNRREDHELSEIDLLRDTLEQVTGVARARHPRLVFTRHEKHADGKWDVPDSDTSSDTESEDDNEENRRGLANRSACPASAGVNLWMPKKPTHAQNCFHSTWKGPSQKRLALATPRLVMA